MEPTIAQKGPYEVDLEEGKTVFWCACGKSDNQPFCNGSHVGTDFSPIEFTPDRTGKFFLCGCKRTAIKPVCDGSHTTL